MLENGFVLDGRYEITDLLASGGMGEVYRARRVLLGDEVAIKTVRPAGSGADTIRQRFMREARACAQLRHPHIVSILDFNVGPNNQPYLVMEYLNGPSVKDELAAAGPYSLEQVRRIAPPLCGAIQVAHDHGIVHRDLKPANLVSHRFESGEVVYKVIDFGVANMRAAASEARLTQADEFVGTISYASPEQLESQEVDGRTDVYSFAAVVFEMLTGCPPFVGPTPMAVLTKHLCEDPPAASSVRPGLPTWLDDVLRRGLAKRPDERWPTIAAFGRALQPADDATFDVTVPQAPASGLLAKYDLGPQIATGRLGSVVHAGTHRALGHPVAVRILRRGSSEKWDAVRTRFLHEARAMQVVHPSIVQVRDFGEEGDLVYVVTDLLQGKSLRQLLDGEGPLPWPRVSRLGPQLMEATAVLHRRGILLGGLSPQIIRVITDDEGERLIVSSGGISEVRDLLSTLSDQTLRGGEVADAELPYIAPEILTGKPANVRSDIYNLGVICYEMATRRLPFAGRTLPQLLGALLQGLPPDPREVQPSIPEAAAACILRCLAREPELRFGSTAELRAAWPA